MFCWTWPKLGGGLLSISDLARDSCNNNKTFTSSAIISNFTTNKLHRGSICYKLSTSFCCSPLLIITIFFKHRIWIVWQKHGSVMIPKVFVDKDEYFYRMSMMILIMEKTMLLTLTKLVYRLCLLFLVSMTVRLHHATTNDCTVHIVILA